MFYCCVKIVAISSLYKRGKLSVVWPRDVQQLLTKLKTSALLLLWSNSGTGHILEHTSVRYSVLRVSVPKCMKLSCLSWKICFAGFYFWNRHCYMGAGHSGYALSLFLPCWPTQGNFTIYFALCTIIKSSLPFSQRKAGVNYAKEKKNQQ